MKHTDLAPDGGSGLDVALEKFAAGSGARSAALMDRQGSVLAQTGFRTVGRAADLALLAAGIHASGRRIGEVAHSGAVGELVAVGSGGHVTVEEMAGQGGAVLLLSVFEPESDVRRVSQAVEVLRGVVARPPDRSGPLAALESTMLERLDHTFSAE